MPPILSGMSMDASDRHDKHDKHDSDKHTITAQELDAGCSVLIVRCRILFDIIYFNLLIRLHLIIIILS